MKVFYYKRVMVKSDASGVDEIPLSFVKMLLPVVLPTLTHLFNFIFTCSEFRSRRKSEIFRQFLTLQISLMFVQLVFFPICSR
jgi:hypothetical protein